MGRTVESDGGAAGASAHDLPPSQPVDPPAGPAEAGARGRSPERISGVLLVLLMLGAFGLVLRPLVQVASGPLPAHAGARAPAFTASTPTGAPIALSDYRGKVVLVDFWATWCPPCVASMPALERLHRAYQGRGFAVLGVDQDPGDEAGVRAFVAAHDLTFPIAMDPGTIARDYGAYSFPTSYLVDRQGVVRRVHHGPAVESSLRPEIEDLLQASTSTGSAR